MTLQLCLTDLLLATIEMRRAVDSQKDAAHPWLAMVVAETGYRPDTALRSVRVLLDELTEVIHGLRGAEALLSSGASPEPSPVSPPLEIDP